MLLSTKELKRHIFSIKSPGAPPPPHEKIKMLLMYVNPNICVNNTVINPDICVNNTVINPPVIAIIPPLILPIGDAQSEKYIFSHIFQG